MNLETRDGRRVVRERVCAFGGRSSVGHRLTEEERVELNWNGPYFHLFAESVGHATEKATGVWRRLLA